MVMLVLVLMPAWTRGNMAWRVRIGKDLIRGYGCGGMKLEGLLMLAKWLWLSWGKDDSGVMFVLAGPAEWEVAWEFEASLLLLLLLLLLLWSGGIVG